MDSLAVSQCCSLRLHEQIKKWNWMKKSGAAIAMVIVLTISATTDSIFKKILAHGKYVDNWTKTLKRTPEANNVQLKYYKTFAYYTFAEECLGQKYLSDRALGHFADRDVYVLSRKAKCRENYKHVYHTFEPRSSWVTGRNFLYRTVKRRNIRYKYHIFFDEDMQLILANYNVQPLLTSAESKRTKVNAVRDRVRSTERGNFSAWRRLEQSLLLVSPAVAVVDEVNSLNRQEHTKMWKMQCRKSEKLPPVTVTFSLVASFIAFHNEAAPLLLPYGAEDKNDSRFRSVAILMTRAWSYLYRQCVSFWDLAVVPSVDGGSNDTLMLQYLNFHWKDTSLESRNLSQSVNEVYSSNHATGPFTQQWLSDQANCAEPLKFPVHSNYKLL